MSSVQEQIARKTIEEIHLQFDTAQDRLVAEAQAIVNQQTESERIVAERLEKIGFGFSKKAKTYLNRRQEITEAKALLNDIAYCKIAYPLYKFITEQEVSKLCQKYGLMLGDSYKYTGDIPEKNLAEIEAFRLKKEDSNRVSEIGAFAFDHMMLQYQIRRNGFYGTDPIRTETESNFARLGYTTGNPSNVNSGGVPAFKIVAPVTDFKINIDDRVEGYKLINDPIVLCPLRGGYLVISKWGLEASDEAVINEQMN